MPTYMFQRTTHEACQRLHFEDGDIRELPESFSQFPWWILVEEPVDQEQPIASMTLLLDDSMPTDEALIVSSPDENGDRQAIKLVNIASEEPPTDESSAVPEEPVEAAPEPAKKPRRRRKQR